MKAGQQNVGSHTAFVDSVSGESVLEMASDANGVKFIAYRLYDSQGTLAAESNGFKRLRRGLSIRCKGGEQLLHIPKVAGEPMQYCLYGPSGNLLTRSDGQRTRIFGVLRMNGAAKGWTLPMAEEPTAGG
jgi:hypothetical protein